VLAGGEEGVYVPDGGDVVDVVVAPGELLCGAAAVGAAGTSGASSSQGRGGEEAVDVLEVYIWRNGNVDSSNTTCLEVNTRRVVGS